ELMLPLEQLRARIGFIVPSLGRRVTQAGGDLRLRLAELGPQRERFFLQLDAEVGKLGVGPRILARPHRQGGGPVVRNTVRRSGHVRFLGSLMRTDNGGYGSAPSAANPFGDSRIPRSLFCPQPPNPESVPGPLARNVPAAERGAVVPRGACLVPLAKLTPTDAGGKPRCRIWAQQYPRATTPSTLRRESS